jgi:hypothetical protein
MTVRSLVHGCCCYCVNANERTVSHSLCLETIFCFPFFLFFFLNSVNIMLSIELIYYCFKNFQIMFYRFLTSLSNILLTLHSILFSPHGIC